MAASKESITLAIVKIKHNIIAKIYKNMGIEIFGLLLIIYVSSVVINAVYQINKYLPKKFNFAIIFLPVLNTIGILIIIFKWYIKAIDGIRDYLK